LLDVSEIRTGIDFSQAMVSNNKTKLGGMNDRETGKLT
jgi:hypothetical protein